jgi:hypothetical protein
MGEQEQATHDEPIGKTWSDDWAAAEQKSAAYDDNKGDDNEEVSESSGEELEGSDETSSVEDGSASGEEAQLGEEPDGRDNEDGGQREVSRKRGLQRELDGKPRAERIKALREEAVALGLEFEGNAVTVSDRARFREEKRNLKNRLAAERQSFEEEANAATVRLQAQAEKATKLQAAIEANDLDAIAQAVGVQSWNHLSEQALKRQLNPEHMELMRLRREQREQIEHVKKQKVEYANHQAAQEREQARAQYRTDVSQKLSTSKKFKAFADDPLFLSGVLKHQEANWDGEDTLTLEEASELALKDARFVYDKLHQRFGGRTAQQSENQSASGTIAEKPGRRAPPKSVSQSEVADASGTDDSGEFDQAAWLKKWSPKIKGSTAQS